MVTWRAIQSAFVMLLVALQTSLVLATDTADDAGDTSQTMMEQLTPLDQIRVVVGLFTIIVLGLVIFIVIKAGSHMAKGFSAAANRLSPTTTPNEDDWASKPLNDPVESGDRDPQV